MSKLRTAFDFSNVKLNWFPGHMATSTRIIRSRISQDVDLILEIRDARIPISSRNSYLLDSVADKPRIVVYNKSDLADEVCNRRLFKTEGSLERNDNLTHFLMCSNEKRSVNNLLSIIKEKFMHTVPNNPLMPSPPSKVMVLGIPNVGKSTIINALRSLSATTDDGPSLIKGRKAARTGALPGVTRSVSELITLSIRPKIYLIDTPGITMPRISNVEEGMKVALTGGLFDKTVGEYLLADYLLFILNRYNNQQYLEFFGLTEPMHELNAFLPIVAKRIGALKTGGLWDYERCLSFLLKHFRQGRFGRFTLDDI